MFGQVHNVWCLDDDEAGSSEYRKGLLLEDSGPSGNSQYSPKFSSVALSDRKPCLGILKVPQGINHQKHPSAP